MRFRFLEGFGVGLGGEGMAVPASSIAVAFAVMLSFGTLAVLNLVEDIGTIVIVSGAMRFERGCVPQEPKVVR